MPEPMPVFRTKDFIGLTDAMILTLRAHTDLVTDFNVGSVVRTLLEAPALEVDELYQRMVMSLLDSIPVAIYLGFDFAALPAVAASGYVTFTYDLQSGADERPLHIPAGTVVRNPAADATYVTLSDATLGSNVTSVDVAIACTQVGLAGNAWANTLSAYTTPRDRLSCNNPVAVTGGREAETATERRQRFVLFIQSLARGTVAALQYAATKAAVVASGIVIERAARIAVEETPGHVKLWIYGTGGEPTAALLTAIERQVEGYFDETLQQWVPGYRPAGMRVAVAGMTALTQAVSMEIDALAADRSAALIAAITAEIERAILTEPSGGSLRPSELLTAALRVPKVNGALLLSPTQSVAVPYNRALVPGAITLTWSP